MLLKGRVMKAAGGFFTVLTGDGFRYLCQARGSLKRGEAALYVGDIVDFKPENSSSSAEPRRGVIEKKHPRKNKLIRPAVVNMDQLIIVASKTEPPVDWGLISRLCVMAEQTYLKTVICINKIDLLSTDEVEAVKALTSLYPYPLLFTSTKIAAGIKELEEKMCGVVSVLAGPSGAGKSSLLNSLYPDLKLKTGAVSEKIGRGRHTTRHAELLSLECGGCVVDTPGFTRLSFQGIKASHLPGLFPEFTPFKSKCAFRDCRHLKEPGCAVTEAVGPKISPLRYEHYTSFAKEIDQLEEEYW